MFYAFGFERVGVMMGELYFRMTAAGVGTGDAEALRQAASEIMDVPGRLLDRMKAGQLALASGDEELVVLAVRLGFRSPVRPHHPCQPSLHPQDGGSRNSHERSVTDLEKAREARRLV